MYLFIKHCTIIIRIFVCTNILKPRWILLFVKSFALSSLILKPKPNNNQNNAKKAGRKQNSGLLFSNGQTVCEIEEERKRYNNKFAGKITNKKINVHVCKCDIMYENNEKKVKRH